MKTLPNLDYIRNGYIIVQIGQRVQPPI